LIIPVASQQLQDEEAEAAPEEAPAEEEAAPAEEEAAPAEQGAEPAEAPAPAPAAASEEGGAEAEGGEEAPAAENGASPMAGQFAEVACFAAEECLGSYNQDRTASMGLFSLARPLSFACLHDGVSVRAFSTIFPLPPRYYLSCSPPLDSRMLQGFVYFCTECDAILEIPTSQVCDDDTPHLALSMTTSLLHKSALPLAQEEPQPN